MKKKMEQEESFLNQVEEVLHSYEDAYEDGAWEEFVATRKKQQRKWPVYAWAAAAIILMLLSFGLFEITRKDQLHNNDIVVKKEAEQRQPNINIETKAIPYKPVDTGGLVERKLVVAVTDNIETTTTTKIIESVADPIITIAKQNDVPIKAEPFDAKEQRSASVIVGSPDSFAAVAQDDEKNTRKLTYSLVVSPTVSDQKVNLGGGMEVSYRLGEHLSVSSGLMYTAISATSDGNSLMASNNSRAQHANLAVAGIEVPLGIQYHTKGGFYASAGVSALGLVNDKLEYSYLAEKTVSMPQSSPGITNEVLKVVNEKQTETSIEPLNNYMGFFNFSAGKKQAIGNMSLNIGPFVKVPFSSVSSEKIKLLQGGIKISVDF